MKLPKQKTGLSTVGLLGITLIILTATGFLPVWWYAGGIFFTVVGIGHESGE